MKKRLTLIRHTGLEVERLPRALVFWEHALGMELISLVEEPWAFPDTGNGLWLKVARLWDHEGNVLELVEAPWKGHVSVHVKEFPKRWNSETAEPAQRGRLKVWFGTDSDGNRVELVKGEK